MYDPKAFRLDGAVALITGAGAASAAPSPKPSPALVPALQ
jgi:hypothetical protein